MNLWNNFCYHMISLMDTTMNLITSEEKNDGKEIAQWNKNLVDIFCALCVKSIEAGSKPGTHFDTKGWKQLIAEFTKATGKEYNRKQLRNKWSPTFFAFL
ncbi:hypothetical protein HN873_025370 [Arachis hypogaea]